MRPRRAAATIGTLKRADLDQRPLTPTPQPPQSPFVDPGDAGAKALLPFLREQKHIRKFRMTPRLGRDIMAAVQEAVRANLPKRKKVVRKKKPPPKKL